MNCERARTTLSDYVMEEVTAAEKLEIRQHVEGCAACAEELERLQQTMTLLARAEVPEEIPQRIRLVAEAVRASEARQQLSVSSLVQTVTEQAEQQRLRDLEELSEGFRYIQAAQTMMWKDQVESQEVMGALARQAGLPGAQP